MAKLKVKLFAYKPRLMALLKRPGGITAEQATAAARANLETIRRDSLYELDKVIAQIVALREPLRTTPSAAQTDRLYALSGTVIGIAGTFGLVHVQAAATSLCELLDELDTQKRDNPEAVDVHLSGLNMLRSAGQDASPMDAAAVLAGLAEVVRAVGDKRA